MEKYKIVVFAIITGITVMYLFSNLTQKEELEKTIIEEETYNHQYESNIAKDYIETKQPATDDTELTVQTIGNSMPGSYAEHSELNRIVELELSNISAYDMLIQLTQLLTNEEPTVRIAAVEYISEMKHPSAIMQLTELLVDDEPEIRIMAIEALAQQTDVDFAIYIESMLFDENKDVRIAALKGLAEYESDQSIYALSGLLSDLDDDIRMNAVNALGEIGGEQADNYLSQLIADPNEMIRESVLAILDESAY
ncbi:MAG: HEAT repeat domain-containing protein [Candidatus Thiodiazotropha sp.]